VAAPSDSYYPSASGKKTWYGDIVTTDRQGENGYNTAASPEGDYAYDFGGTSAAAPQVSGVVALMLEANPDLGYRDVQDILALTARNTDTTGSWNINGATDWNGGGLHVSRDVGYGLVDATAAVRLAETWDGQSTASNLLTFSGEATAGVTLADGTGSTSSTITVPAGLSVERAEVVLDLADADVSDLTAVLTSPSGTQSVLFDSPGLSAAFPADFAMTSTHFLGESSQGTWTLTVYDTDANGDSASFGGWTLNLLGNAATADTRYVYTNEYSDYAATDASRRLLADASGTDTINPSPVTANAAINLGDGTISVVDGTPLVIAPLTTIENAATGDGNDLLVGNATANDLTGGRGNDVLMGGWGNNVIDGGSGYDVAGFDRNFESYQIGQSGNAVTVSSLEGVTTLTNVEALSFADRVVPTQDLLTTGATASGTALLAGTA